MNDTSKPAKSHGDHDHAHGGSCCGGGAEAKTKPQDTPANKATQIPASGTKTKPAGSSGCCGG